jgi:DNA-nicking Smr family endonuclease
VLDLHGLFVKEALQAVQDEVRRAKKEKRSQLVLIVGAGHHSRDGVQRIRPAVEKMMREAGHRYEAMNQGCLKVYLREPSGCCLVQ